MTVNSAQNPVVLSSPRGGDAAAPGATMPVDSAADAVGSGVHERVLTLFRHSIAQGRLNPLMHHVLQYRQGSQT